MHRGCGAEAVSVEICTTAETEFHSQIGTAVPSFTIQIKSVAVLITWYGMEGYSMACTVYPKSQSGLKQVQTQLLSFYVTLIHKNPKELNPKIR